MNVVQVWSSNTASTGSSGSGMKYCVELANALTAQQQEPVDGYRVEPEKEP